MKGNKMPEFPKELLVKIKEYAQEVVDLENYDRVVE